MSEWRAHGFAAIQPKPACLPSWWRYQPVREAARCSAAASLTRSRRFEPERTGTNARQGSVRWTDALSTLIQLHTAAQHRNRPKIDRFLLVTPEVKTFTDVVESATPLPLHPARTAAVHGC